MTEPRPAPVGRYEVLQDFNCPAASVRVLRLARAAEHIDQHVHRRSMQIYLGVEGQARIVVDGVEHLIGPYEALPVWPGSEHGATAGSREATLVNISIPPLAADDQMPVGGAAEPPDLRLPRGGEDVND